MNLLNIEHISKIYGEKIIFDDASFGVQEGDKIGIVGINGTGKTTLLRMIAGTEVPDDGQIIRQNGMKIAHLTQNPVFPEGATILSYVQSVAEDMEWRVQSNLNTLGITDHTMKIEHLSGGQKRRVAMAKVLAEDFDLLLLDEPTNHLDGEMISWLEGYLRAYRGTVIMVTHDRYFLDNVVDRIFELDGKGGIRQYEGGYSDYLNAKRQQEESAAMVSKIKTGSSTGKGENKKGEEPATEENKEEKASKKTWKQNRQEKVKFTYKEQREYETIDEDIAKLEEKLASIERQITANATNSVKLRELMEKQENCATELEEKEERWMYLNELAEQMGL